MSESACGEYTTIFCGGQEVKVICGEPKSAHTAEAAKMDVGMDHAFLPSTFDYEVEE